MNSKQIQAAKASFTDCQDLLTALGDENRQNILLALMDTTCQEGMRVGEITEAVNLSRPAVSHHLKILRDVGFVNIRQSGTMNFYSANIKTNFAKLKLLLNQVEEIGEHRNV